MTWEDVAERVVDYAAAGLLRDADRALQLAPTLDPLFRHAHLHPQDAVARNLVGTSRAFLATVDAHLAERLGSGYAPADSWLEGTWEEEPYSGFYFRPPDARPGTPRHWLGVYACPAGATLRLELAGDVQRRWPPESWPLAAATVAAEVTERLARPPGGEGS